MENLPGTGPSAASESTRDLTSGVERRRTFRLNKVIPAHIERLEAGGKSQDAGWRVRILDISAGGFRATHGRKMVQGEVLRVNIFLNQVDPVVVTGHVVWTRSDSTGAGYEFGCEFDDVSESAWRRLVDFIVHEATQMERGVQ